MASLAPIQGPDNWPVVLISAGFGAALAVAGHVCLHVIGATAHKLRKYEEELVSQRTEKCNELLRLVTELCEHINPVAKGTAILAKRYLGRPSGEDDGHQSDREITRKLREQVTRFAMNNELYLGRTVCLRVAYYDRGFERIRQEISLNDDADHCFYTLCRWTWNFEDGVKAAMNHELRNAKFSPPSSLDVQAACGKGWNDAGNLSEEVKRDPDRYSIDKRNDELAAAARKLQLPSE